MMTKTKDEPCDTLTSESGCGGFSLAASRIGGITTTQLVEINPDAQTVLRDNFPGIPIHSDIRDYHPKRGEFELITGGSPCQDLSCAGNRKGINGDRSGLWFEMLRVIVECQPCFVIWENVEGAINRGLREVLASLRMVGYSFDHPQLISAAELGAGHRRPRLFVVSYSDSQRVEGTAALLGRPNAKSGGETKA